MREQGAIFLRRWFSRIFLPTCAPFLLAAASFAQQPNSTAELLSLSGEVGQRGGRIVLSLRA
jgi:hypothetical protein